MQNGSPLNKYWAKVTEFPTGLRSFFTSSKWCVYETIANGECGMDTMAIALNLKESNAKVWKKLRTLIPTLIINADQSDEQKALQVQPKRWLPVDNLTCIFLQYFKIIPIIVNTSYAIPGEFSFPLPPFAKYDELEQQLHDELGKDVKYVLIKFSPGHFQPYGAMCKQVGDQPNLVKTIFTADRLPPGLLIEWKKQYMKYKEAMDAKYPKKSLRKKHINYIRA